MIAISLCPAGRNQIPPYVRGHADAAVEEVDLL
jgi:hypothetical protein